MDASWAEQTDKGVVLNVRASPKSKFDSIVFDGCRITVRVRAKAIDDKANIAVVGLLKPLVGRCRIESGRKSRNKRILCEGADIEAVKSAFESLAK